MSDKRRIYGEHLTPIEIFKKFILPDIKDTIYDYIWVDLFGGVGNLILPILELIPEEKRNAFFEKHIFLFDIQEELVEKARKNAMAYGIDEKIARKNILQRDTIKNYPTFILKRGLPVYHITNPPYLYLGYIMKHKETHRYLEYFKGENEGYQDLYQIALINDLRHNIQKMIYIIPSNFLFGASVSNKIRKDFLKYYKIKKALIFEEHIFRYTGTNVVICFFERKQNPKHEVLKFEGLKFNRETKKRLYFLTPENNYRAGAEFDEFVKKYKAKKPINVTYYLTIEEVNKNRGSLPVEVIDANNFDGKKYKHLRIFVNESLYNKIKSNILFIRTVDTGSKNGRAGLYKIKEEFGVDGILVTKTKYRTHPIQLFFNPSLTPSDQVLLMDYFNLLLEHFRKITDSEFMTTYKYSDSEYTRKYLGLSQAKALIKTFPLFSLKEKEKIEMQNLIKEKNTEDLIRFIKKKNSERGLYLWL